MGGAILIGGDITGTDDPGNDNVAIVNTKCISAFAFTGSGNDSVFLQGLQATGDVLVTLGSGDDALVAAFASVKHNFIASAGSGNDVLITLSTQFGGFSVNLDAGNDILAMEDLTTTNSNLPTTINMGTGNDKASIGLQGPSTIASQLQISGSQGVDQFYVSPLTVIPLGVQYQEVESTGPYSVLDDTLALKAHAAVVKRFDNFASFVANLP